MFVCEGIRGGLQHRHDAFKKASWVEWILFLSALQWDTVRLGLTATNYLMPPDVA